MDACLLAGSIMWFGECLVVSLMLLSSRLTTDGRHVEGTRSCISVNSESGGLSVKGQAYICGTVECVGTISSDV